MATHRRPEAGYRAPAGSKPLNDEPAVRRSVDDLYRTLVDQCGVHPDQINRLIDPPDGTVIGDAVHGAVNSHQAGGVLLFYFVGHGLIGHNGQLHLATSGTIDSDIRLGTPTLPYDGIRDELARVTDPASVIVILDCCYAARADVLIGSLQRSAFGSATSSGTYLLAATGRNSQAFAPPGHRHTALTGAIIDLLRNGDPKGPRYLTVRHAYSFVARVLHGVADPQEFESGRGGSIVLVRNGAYVSEPRDLPAVAPHSNDDGAPYQGLQAFEEEDSEFFFGRKTLVSRLLDALSQGLRDPGLIAVVGSSGSGKSSLLRAGLLPALRQGHQDLPGANEWRRLVVMPGTHPVATLAEAVSRLTEMPEAETREQLLEDPVAVVRTIVGRRTGADVDRRLLIVVDQFEEVFDPRVDPDERLAYVRALDKIVRSGPSAEQPLAMVVLAVRADFFQNCLTFAELRPAVERPVVVVPMNEAELREAIEGPAKRASLRLAPGFSNRLLQDLSTGPRTDDAVARSLTEPSKGGSGHLLPAELLRSVRSLRPDGLPLLSYALLATWQRRSPDGWLTLESYEATGGIWSSVAQRAEEIYNALDAESPRTDGAESTVTGERPAQRAACQLLLSMVQVGNRTDDSRRAIDFRELVAGRDPEEVRLLTAARDAFAAPDARLLTITGDTVQITHEALLRAWRRLSDWIDADRVGLLAHQRLTEAARAWAAGERDPGLLSRGKFLADGRAVAKDRGPLLDRIEREFLEASEAAERSELRRWQRLVRRLTVASIALVALLVGVVGAGVYASSQQRKADRQARIATVRQLALEAAALRERDPRTALQLALAAHRIEPDGVATSTLLNLLTTSPFLGTLTGNRGSAINGVSFSADGRTLASVGGDGAVLLWDVSQDGAPRRLGDALAVFRPAPRSVAFSPDGRTLVVGKGDGAIAMWAIGEPGPPRRLPDSEVAHSGDVSSVVFSRDGRLIASAGGEDGVVALWRLAGEQVLARVSTVAAGLNESWARSVAFSADGRILAAGTGNGVITLWDLGADARSPQGLPTIVVGRSTSVESIAFSPVSATLVAGLGDNTILGWRVDDLERPRRLPMPSTGHRAAVGALAFAPDGKILASASDDYTVLQWDFSRPGLPERVGARLSGHRWHVRAIAFSPDGQRLATGSRDGDGMLWRVRNRYQPKPLEPLTSGLAQPARSLAFAPDSRRRLAVVADQTVQVWDVATSDGLPRQAGRPFVRADPPPPMSVAFVPRTTFLAVGYRDGAVILWDLRTGASAGPPLTGLRQSAMAVAASVDGRSVAAASAGGEVRVWALDEGGPRLLGGGSLSRHGEGELRSVDFSPDGKFLVAAGDTGPLTAWDMTDREQPMRLEPLQSGSRQPSVILFMPSGTDPPYLISGDRDGVVTLWDMAVRAPAGQSLTGHGGGVRTFASSAASPILVSAGDDQSLILWDLADSRSPQRLGDPIVLPESVPAVAVSGDATVIAALRPGGSVALWDLTQLAELRGRLAEEACRLVGDGFDETAWKVHVKGVDFEPTCG
ncbi:caspase, EACC1-associated type [Phytohabitans aurantiacus]|uniref:caspase, EACC1-associated type n=1 Tax=Phytohabitans aurantiacus TaxID=3016789 RepID=UPI003899EF1A